MASKDYLKEFTKYVIKRMKYLDNLSPEEKEKYKVGIREEMSKEWQVTQ